MRLGVISDTHGSDYALKAAVRAAGEVDAWAHLGDFVRDACSLEALTEKPVYFVRGNCDPQSSGEAEKVITLEGTRFFLSHGHRQFVHYGETHAVAERAEALGCTVALYGHTHISSIEALGSIILINPGSPASPRGGRERSICVIDISADDVYPRIITL